MNEPYWGLPKDTAQVVRADPARRFVWSWDEFFGVWSLIPWLNFSTPTPGVVTEQHWDISVGWLRWGVTLTIYLHPSSTTVKPK